MQQRLICLEQYINKIIEEDALKVLKDMPAEFVDMVITSPPYWGLRDYGKENQIGLEENPQEFIKKLCDIFDEIRRVLKKDGTCWVNLGDTYAANRTYQVSQSINDGGNTKNDIRYNNRGMKVPDGMRPKSLIMIPSRFAIEMINRGWILRNEIIWQKPNCMPASVIDRFTVDFEMMYLFSK